MTINSNYNPEACIF